jgi:hypothetical protein
MSMFNSGPRNEPRPPRPPRPPMPRPEMDSRDSVAKRPSASPRMEPKQRPQARPQMPKQQAKASQTKARIQDSRNIVPGGPGADTFQNDMMGAAMPFLTAPSRVARGAVEGGIQAINPDFEMPDYSNAQIPGVDFMNFITGSAAQDQGRRMPMQRNIDPGTDAILRAIMMRMQGGQ